VPCGPDGYRLIEPIGAGAMGEVWRAEHRLLGRLAAVKLLRPESRANPARAEIAQRRLAREAKTIARLRCPHTVELYDFGCGADGSAFYVMEHLEGLDLLQMVERFGPMSPARVVRLLIQACRSLDEAHRMGLVHRDIKPANLFVCRLGTQYDFLKVLDFGIVSAREDEGRLTEPGTLQGTPAYLSPEMIKGEAYDGRSDLYALGAIAYYLLTGELVFDAPGVAQMCMAHVHKDPAPPSSRDRRIPKSLDRIVLRCLEKRPEDRYASAGALADALVGLGLEGEWTDEDAEHWWTDHEGERPESPTKTGGLSAAVAKLFRR
jgi:serine/threonine-protein kinase